jgi:serine/threonine protein kinase
MSQFRIEETISESGSTSVYRAHQETLDRRVLLKVLHQHLANDPVVRERFTREAHACAHLRSEHIVQIYDLTEYNGCPAIVMEFVHGQSLKELIESSSYDHSELAKRTAVSILRALSVAHRKGIVHRDIKPGNILVAEDGTVKLTDFGLAHITDSPTMTLQGSVLGTPAYMAPEQVRGETIDERTDLFALGATLVEVSTGERIFAGENYSECVQKVGAFKTVQLDRFETQFSGDFLAFLKHLMEPSPDDRFRSAKEALEALHEKSEEVGEKMPEPTLSKVQLGFGLSAVVILLSILTYSVVGHRSPGNSSLGYGDQKYEQDAKFTQDSTNELMQGRPHQSVSSTDDPLPVTRQNSRHDAKSSQPGSINDSGDVRFTSNPWAKVYVDGGFVGETPISQAVHLSRGKHIVTFSNPSFDPILKTVEVGSGKEGYVAADFLLNAGYLQCAVKPWAEVYVDEQYKDTTPLNKPIVCSAGKHTVRFHNSAFSDVIREISVKAQDTLMITATLPALH